MEDTVRRASKALFGSKYRVEVASAIHAAGRRRFYAREIAEDLGLADNLVQLELKHFESAGLIVRLERTGVRSPQFFRAKSSPYWRLNDELRRRPP